MLRVLGALDRFAGRISRRQSLQIGSLGALALPQLMRQQTAAAAQDAERPPARAKQIILLYLYGAAAQHELFDPKPDAPAEIRGEFGAIATSVPGIQIGEHLPKLAAISDRVTLLRSMCHPFNIHSAAYTLTGVPVVDIPMEVNAYDPRHWPCFGSVLHYLDKPHASAGGAALPHNIALPFQFTSRLPGNLRRGGPYGGFLGRAYEPLWTDFDGEGTETVARWTGSTEKEIHDPYLAISPDSRLMLSQGARLRPELTLDRLDRRRALHEQLDDQRRAFDGAIAAADIDRFEHMAYSLLTSQTLRNALDVSQEPAERRERYGMTLFGQSTLAGLRLLDAGARLVTVVWDEYGTVNSAWDTHFNHYERLKRELLPGLDRALSALILDLEERGRLDETLVMCLTEHGRTPQLFPKERGVGREHWSHVYCSLLAGAGIKGGNVVGRSDQHAAYVADNPVSPKDVLCTMYHLLGLDPHATTIPDAQGRPYPLVSEGRVLQEALA
jgi:uncharacterized protein (DUF1501 family)